MITTLKAFEKGLRRMLTRGLVSPLWGNFQDVGGLRSSSDSSTEGSDSPSSSSSEIEVSSSSRASNFEA